MAKQIRRIVSCLISGLLILSYSSHLGPARAEGVDELIHTEIRKVLTAQVEAWNQGNIEEFMRGYWNSPDLTFTSGGHVRRGWRVTLEQYKKSYPDRAQRGELSFDDLEIHVLESSAGTKTNSRAAWVLGKWRLKRANDEPHGIFTLIFQKISSPGGRTAEWKIVHDHTSSALSDKR